MSQNSLRVFDWLRSLVLQAVKQNGGALAYADPALQEDRGADRDPVAEVVKMAGPMKVI